MLYIDFKHVSTKKRGVLTVHYIFAECVLSLYVICFLLSIVEDFGAILACLCFPAYASELQKNCEGGIIPSSLVISFLYFPFL